MRSSGQSVRPATRRPCRGGPIARWPGSAVPAAHRARSCPPGPRSTRGSSGPHGGRGGVGDVERRTTSGERDDVVDGQVAGRVGWAPVARAPVAVLAAPGTQHPSAEALPRPGAVQGVVPAPVGQAAVLGAATTSAAGDDTAERAQLHPRIVGGLADVVYTPAVLGLRNHVSPKGQRALTARALEFATLHQALQASEITLERSSHEPGEQRTKDGKASCRGCVEGCGEPCAVSCRCDVE